MKQKNRDRIKAGGTLTILAVGFIASILFISNITPMVEETEVRSWHRLTLPYLGDNDPGAGASGVINNTIIVRNCVDYTTNFTINSSVYGFADAHNDHMNNIPYDTGAAADHFELAITVRWNKTHAFSESNTTWMLTWVRGNCTCAGLSIGANTTMTEVNHTDITADHAFIYVTYYLDNSGDGYTLTRGQNVTSCMFFFDAYY